MNDRRTFGEKSKDSSHSQGDLSRFRPSLFTIEFPRLYEQLNSDLRHASAKMRAGSSHGGANPTRMEYRTHGSVIRFLALQPVQQ